MKTRIGFFCFLHLSLFALPSGGQIVHGEASILSQENSLQVQAQGKTIIEWQGFDIGAQERVSFAQTRSSNPILNKVLHGEISQILGHLEANCPIYLVNPQGVFIGSAAQIETAGFLATTADISNQQFLQGNELIIDTVSKESIINLGNIQTIQGDVFFIARTIENRGSIEAPNGQVCFSTAELVLHPDARDRVFIRPNMEGGNIDNSGFIRALSIELQTTSPYEKAICHTGVLEAGSILEESGKIYLIAENGASLINGSLDAPSGEIRILGKEIVIEEFTQIDVSGASGGSVLIGGDFQGRNPDILRADNAYIAKGAQIAANGLSGDGGKIVIWSNGKTFCDGDLSAAAIGNLGSGGVIEVSGLQTISLSTHPDLTAKNGKTGEMVIDPGSMTITSGPNVAPIAPFASINDGWISDQLENFSSLTLCTGGSGCDVTSTNGAAETLTVNGTAAITWSSSNTLTLRGERNVVLSAGSSIIATGAGGIVIEGGLATPISGSYLGISGNGIIQTNTGPITLTGFGGDGGGGTTGIVLTGAGSLTQSTDGIITLSGTGKGTVTGNGIAVQSGAILSAIGTGAITLNGNASLIGASNQFGVVVSGSGSVSTNSGNIDITGVGAGLVNNNRGVFITSLGGVSSSSGRIKINGTGSLSGVNNGRGISVQNSSTVMTDSGDIEMMGIGGGVGSFNMGLRLEDSGIISSASGKITLSGMGSVTGADNCGGVEIRETCSVSSVSGDIEITGFGKGGATNNWGLLLFGVASVASTDGQITLSGTGSPLGTDSSQGIILNSPTSITTDTGNIKLTGFTSGVGSGVDSFGEIVSNSGKISVEGTNDNHSASSQFGIQMSGATSMISNVDGDIELIGTAMGSSTGNTNRGIQALSGSAITASGTGAVTLFGIGGAGTSDLQGILINGLGTVVSALDGALHLTGIGTGMGSISRGVQVSSGANIVSLGQASILLDGIGSSVGSTLNEGVLLGSATTITSSVNGSIQIIGTAGGGTTSGITLASGSSVVSTGGASISMQTLNDLVVEDNSSITALGSGGITLDVGSDLIVSGGASANAPAFISVTDGNGIFRVSSNVSITGGQGANSAAFIGNDMNANASGSMSFSIGGNCTLLGQASFVQIGHVNQAGSVLGGDISIAADGNINITGGTSVAAYARIGHGGQTGGAIFNASTMQLTAGIDLTMTSNTAEAQVINSNGPLTLVVDNLFPSPPDFGPGAFILNSNLSATGPLKIYTATQTQNMINDLINGAVFVPGSFNVDSPTEEWGIYFPNGTYEDAPFKFYYKIPDSALSRMISRYIAANLSQLADLLPNLTSPNYHFQLCETIQEQKICAPTFSPFGSFVFEDDVYWIGTEF